MKRPDAGAPSAIGNVLWFLPVLPFGREVVPISELGERRAESIDFGSL